MLQLGEAVEYEGAGVVLRHDLAAMGRSVIIHLSPTSGIYVAIVLTLNIKFLLNITLMTI